MAVLKRLTIDGVSRDLQVLTAGENITIEDDVISALGADLTNCYTKAEVDALIDTINEWNIEVVNELPSTGEEFTLYLVPKQSTKPTNAKDEYIYVNGAWELIGNTEFDASNYYNKDEADALLDDKVDKVDGKGLSTNDYTDADKAKLDGIDDMTKAEILTTLGYKESTIVMTDTDNNSVTKTILVANE